MLVPGRGDSSDLWPPEFRDALVAGGFRVLAFDPRDTGASDASDASEGYDLAAMADDVIVVLDAAGIDRARRGPLDGRLHHDRSRDAPS